MQFYSFFSFSCPAGLPQDCPARRVRICRPFRGKGTSACSKGKTGACVLNRQQRAEPSASPGLCPARRRFPPQKSRCAFGKTPPRRDRAPHFPHRLRSPAQRSRTRRPLSPREKTCVEARLPCFSPPPPSGLRHGRPPCAPPTAGRCAAIPRADAPCISALPEAQNKKRRCRNTVFFCSTRREPGENIRARSCRTFRRVPAPRNICCARGRTCTPCPPAADSLPCRPSPSSF